MAAWLDHHQQNSIRSIVSRSVCQVIVGAQHHHFYWCIPSPTLLLEQSVIIIIIIIIIIIVGAYTHTYPSITCRLDIRSRCHQRIASNVYYVIVRQVTLLSPLIVRLLICCGSILLLPLLLLLLLLQLQLLVYVYVIFF